MVEKKLQYDIKPNFQLESPEYASEFIIAIKVFLAWEAAEWAKINPLLQARVPAQSPTNDDIKAIKQLMRGRFAQRFFLKLTHLTLTTRLEIYNNGWKRLFGILQTSKLYDETGVRDRPENGDSSLATWDGFFSMISSGHLYRV